MIINDNCDVCFGKGFVWERDAEFGFRYTNPCPECSMIGIEKEKDNGRN